ncbi:MAG: NAD(P)-dependent oxidoreductase [Pseudomonadota bacterium]
MFPIALNLTKIRIALVGTGEAFVKRLAQLREMGATQIMIYQDSLPESHEIKQANILMVVGLDNQTSAVLSSIARLQGILVNVEDKPDLCDFYFTSFIKRGDLTISVSTKGASPTVAQEIKAYLSNVFGEEWEGILSEIGENRLSWREQGIDNREIAARTREIIRERNLLSVVN